MKKLLKESLSHLLVIAIFCSMFAMLAGTLSATADATLVSGFESYSATSTQATENISVDNYRKYAGSKSLLCDFSDSSTAHFIIKKDLDGQPFTVTEGTKYVLSFKYYVENASNDDMVFSVAFAKSGSRWYSPSSNDYRLEISKNVTTNVWLNGAFVLDPASLAESNANCIYINIGGASDAMVYFDNFSIEQISSSASVAVIHNEYTGSTQSYYVGTSGTSVPFTTPTETNYNLLGVYSDKDFTTALNSYTFSGTQTDIFLEYALRSIDIDFETFYNDHRMGYYQDYAGIDLDYELSTFTNLTSTKKTYDFETYAFENTSTTTRVKNVTLSTDYADSGTHSLKFTGGSGDGLFIIGNGSADSGLFKVSPGRNYILTFKYLVTGSPNTDITTSIAFAKSGSRWYSPISNATGDTFVISKNSAKSVWRTGKIYIDTSSIKGENYTESVCLYFQFSNMSGGNVYVDNMSIATAGDAANFVTSKKTSFHRKGETAYKENAVLNTPATKFIVGEYYTLKMWVKMDKYAQTNGAISLLRNTSAYSPWTPASVTSSDAVGTWQNDYIHVMPITNLTDGAWHLFSCTFQATAAYIALQTPGYCSIYFDDVSICHLGNAGTQTSNASYTAYTQTEMTNPVYTVAKSNENTLSFEKYPYSYGGKAISTSIDNSSDGSKSANFVSSTVVSTTTNNIKLGNFSDDKTYKITFDYKLSGADATINFATADAQSVEKNVTLYKDVGNFATLSDTQDAWATKTVFLTTDLSYTVKNNSKVNDEEDFTATYGDMLYAYLTKDTDAQTNLYLDNFVISEVTFLASDGVSVLTDSAANTAGSQALRFYFNYSSSNGTITSFDGRPYTVTERGVILASGNNTDGVYSDGSYTVSGLTRQNATEKGAFVITTNRALSSAWSIANRKTTYSFYVKGYDLNEENLTRARGYVKLTDGANTFVVYSDVKNASVSKTKYTVGITSVSDTYHKIGSYNLNGYKIILPNIHSYLLTEAAENLQAYLATVSQSVTIAYDTTSAVTKEILIGGTSRSQTGSVTVTSGDNNYKIQTVSNRLVIKGNSDLAIYTAVMDLIAKLKDYSKYSKGLAMGSSATIMTGSYSASDDTYQLTFDDEFSASPVNTSYWRSHNGYHSAVAEGTSYCGGKTYVVAPNETTFGFTSYITNTSVKSYNFNNGYVNFGTGKFNSTDYYGTSIATDKNMLYKYGVLEIRAKLAKNTMTSFWVNGDTKTARSIFPESRRSAFAEWDLIETRGANDRAASNIHRWMLNDTSTYRHSGAEGNNSDNNDIPFTTRGYGSGCAKLATVGLSSGDLQNGYHIFTFVWENTRARFCVDGKVYWTFNFADCTNTSIFMLSNHLILSVMMGAKGTWTSDALSTIDNSATSVDYVRIYQNNSIGSEITFA